MKLQRFVWAAAVLLASGPTAALARTQAPWSAAAPEGPPAARSHAATTLSMDEAVRMTEQRFHARVVKAETQRDNGHVIYVLRLLNEAGHVWTVRVDAASGAVQ
jgi:uncharacterized membrane protein YkoI